MSKEKATKVCKHCKTEIPAGAKICPNCQKKQGGIIKWIIVGVIVIGVAGAALGGKDNSVKRVDSSEDAVQKKSQNNDSALSESNDTSVTQKDNQDTEDLKFALGETDELDNVQVTLTNITESEGSDYNKPTDGNVFVLAEFEIVNNSEKELTISSMLSFDAYQDGYSTTLSISALLENDSNQLDGAIAPGKKMKGFIGYEIPVDYKELEINLQLDVWSNEKIVFIYEK